MCRAREVWFKTKASESHNAMTIWWWSRYLECQAGFAAWHWKLQRESWEVFLQETTRGSPSSGSQLPPLRLSHLLRRGAVARPRQELHQPSQVFPIDTALLPGCAHCLFASFEFRRSTLKARVLGWSATPPPQLSVLVFIFLSSSA